MKRKYLMISVAVLALGMGSTAYAGQWKTNAEGWWYQEDDGSRPINTWKWIDGNNDGTAECYYFNQHGDMLADTTTPDGYTVDTNGAWVINGVVQTKNFLPMQAAQPPAETSASSTVQLPTETSKPTTVYDGQNTVYKVGTDISAGEYVLFSTSSLYGYYTRYPDRTLEFSTNLDNGPFDYNTIITVNDGEYLKLQRCTMSPISEVPQINYRIGEVFKVGYHIPAGKYKIQTDGQSSYDGYSIENSSDYKTSVERQNFKGEKIISVKDGQYLHLSGAKIIEYMG